MSKSMVSFVGESEDFEVFVGREPELPATLTPHRELRSEGVLLRHTFTIQMLLVYTFTTQMVEYTAQMLNYHQEVCGKFRWKGGGSRSRRRVRGGTSSIPRAAPRAAMRRTALDIQMHHTNKCTHLLQAHTVNA